MSDPDDPATRFARHHAEWANLLARQGSARAYPYAWRLPELARRLDTDARAKAGAALAETLYRMGRFDEAVACLDAHPPAARLAGLRQRCLCLLDHDATGQPASASDPIDNAYLAFLNDDATACLAALPTVAADAPDWPVVLADWARRRLGLSADAGRAHRALRDLRARAPVDAAHAAAIHAEAAFHDGPAWSIAWLDDALEQCEHLGEHHIKARLLRLKADAHAAAGQLADSVRFERLALDLARRQGARLYLAGLQPARTQRNNRFRVNASAAQNPTTP